MLADTDLIVLSIILKYPVLCCCVIHQLVSYRIETVYIFSHRNMKPDRMLVCYILVCYSVFQIEVLYIYIYIHVCAYVNIHIHVTIASI